MKTLFFPSKTVHFHVFCGYKPQQTDNFCYNLTTTTNQTTLFHNKPCIFKCFEVTHNFMNCEGGWWGLKSLVQFIMIKNNLSSQRHLPAPKKIQHNISNYCPYAEWTKASLSEAVVSEWISLSLAEKTQLCGHAAPTHVTSKFVHLAAQWTKNGFYLADRPCRFSVNAEDKVNRTQFVV